MMYPDTETQRQLGRERRAELEQDWKLSNLAEPKVIETRRTRRLIQLRWLRDQFHPAGNLS